jgi:phosphosulfolactate phosphohydrolase-like enzyme
VRRPDRSFVVDAFPDSAFRHRGRDAVACLDVMLASTTLVTAATEGRRVFVASGTAERKALAARHPEALVAGQQASGERGSVEIPDGPCALLRLGCDLRPLVLASPPGTELIANAADGGSALVACFRNVTATAAALARHARVALLVAGCREEMSCEDQMAAAWIGERLVEAGFEPEDRRTAEMVRRWCGIAPALAGWGNSAAELRGAGRGEEVDFVIAHVDDVDRAFQCAGGELTPLDVVFDAAVRGDVRGDAR